jgi:hypothetical protein
MRKLLAVLLVAACGEHKPPPAVAGPTSSPPPTPVVAHVSHPPPTCPLPPLAADPTADNGQSNVDQQRHMAPEHAGDTCELADTNLARAERAILAAQPPASPAEAIDRSGATTSRPTAAAVAAKPWDGKRALQYDQLVGRRLALKTSERALLAKNGFVVLDRIGYTNYAWAFHEIYQSQLPLFVSVDAVLHAIYAGNDNVIADLEDADLRPQLDALLDALACALPAAGASYPEATRRDLDLYLAVARALLRGEPPQSMTGDGDVEIEARQLVARADAAAEMQPIELFGRKRVVDFTAYTPRGHYTASDARKQYFRAAMWLSRLEFNLVSRSSRSSQPGTTPDPSETPREDVDALALADLVERAGQLPALARLDTAWAVLAGRREDVSIAQLVELRRAAKIDSLLDGDPAAKLRAAIGDKFQRTARLHYMPEGSTVLPAIATLLGPRVVPDAAATRPLVHSDVPGRTTLDAADMAYVLGHDRALAYLADARAKYPSLDAQLAKAREIARTAPRGTDDLYSAWLDAVIGLAEKPAGALPSFAAKPAYADLRVDSALAAFGHIKHNFVLIVGESYFEGGCQIPDGYVEPAPATYDALIDYAARGERAGGVLDPADKLGARAYFARLGQILRVLRAIQRDELAGRALTADQRAFLSMVAEMTPGTTGGPPTYTGWWFDLFRDRERDGLAPADYIASYFTGDAISYVGATAPHLGVFVVDTGGPPRLVVGPVARAYEHHGPVAHRLDDEAGKALPEADRAAPWSASYRAPAPPVPKLHVRWNDSHASTVDIETNDDLGAVTIEFFDHHRSAFTRFVKRVKPGKTSIPVKLPKHPAVAGLHVVIGEWDAWYELPTVGDGIYENIGGYARRDE